MQKRLDQLIDEMLTRGVHYTDARRAIERRFISRALARSKGNVGAAAALLGMHRNTLSRKMDTYRLKRSA